MIDITGEKKKRISLQVVVVVFVLMIFFVLLFKYYWPTERVEKENPRFVKIDYLQLKEEADLITPDPLANESAKNVFVLTYHVISKNASEEDYEIYYNQFKENMFTLKRLGYQTVSLDDLYLFMDGKKELPDKSFVLTFDDAAKGGYYNADPILRALNYTAVVFVITGHSLEEKQSAYYLNETELTDAVQTGRWEIGSHTYKSHFRLPIADSGEIAPALTNKLWIPEENRLETDGEFYVRVTEDLTKAKTLLETLFHKPVISFALPYGDFGERGSNYANAQSIVYNLSTSLHKLVFYEFPIKDHFFRGNYNSKEQNSYLISRLPADSLRTPEELMKRINASRALELPYYEDYRNYDRWVRISGTASFEKDHIILKITENSSDDQLFAYLDGSYLWEDYDYSVQTQNMQVNTVLLLSRLTDTGDYVACRYENGFVRIIQMDKGVQKNILEKDYLKNMSNGANLEISVSGSNVKCLIDGVKVLDTNIENLPPHGGVGVRAVGFKGEEKTFTFGNIKIMENSNNSSR